MTDRRKIDELSVDELASVLYRKKRTVRQQRLLRLKKEGRVIDVAGLPAPHPLPPPVARPRLIPNGALRHYAVAEETPSNETTTEEATPRRQPIQFRWVFNQLLLLVALVGVIGFLAVLFSLWATRQDLNQEVAAAQENQSIGLTWPTPSPAPIIVVVVLPSTMALLSPIATPSAPTLLEPLPVLLPSEETTNVPPWTFVSPV